MKVIYLQKNREKPIQHKNHWIFSGSIRKIPEDLLDGEIVQVRSAENKVLGHGFFNSKSQINVRMLNFSDSDPIKELENNIKNAILLRQKLFDESITNSYRIINSEGDKIPGLTVDKYANVLVFQISTLGIEMLKQKIVQIFLKLLPNTEFIYEKSSIPSRKHEGMKDFSGLIWSKNKNLNEFKVEFLENSIKFETDIANSHKTGFYLDQREMRSLIASLSKNKKILNCFSYTGGFSVAAAIAGASKVTSVDISEEVISQAKKNFELNNIDLSKHEFISEDVFEYLNNKDISDFDIVILDPPAFAKKKQDINNAIKGYKSLNKLALQNLRNGALLLTCSCSYHVNDLEFFNSIKSAAAMAKREAKVISKHRYAMDHVLNINHAEIDYLKSYLLYVNND